jgi:FkbM family methyltransferase
MLNWLRSRMGSPDAAAILRKEEARLQRLIHGLPLEPRAKVQGELARALAADALRIDTPKGALKFAVFGETSGFRARGLLTKQKATIAWIDSFAPNAVFWDIGANIGSYTLYAALRSDLRVIAFEPAAVNYFILAANCELNAFGERVDCLQIGVGARKSLERLEVSQFDAAHSFSFRGKRRRPASSRQAALVLSIDELIDEYALPCPHYIKIDVPGMTGAIVEGGTQTLRRPELRELHIEASEQSTGGRRLVEQLAEAGFTIASRHVHGETTDLTFTRRI